MVKPVLIFLVLFALCFAAIATADELKVREDAPERYVVKKGDTLWDISAIYLSQPWRWPQLWRMNPQIDNPHLIFPGDVLRLIYDADGRPMLVRDDRVRRLSPHTRASDTRPGAITTVPLAMIRPFLAHDQMLSQSDLEGKPYILGANSNVKNATEGHTLYARGELEPGKAYAIYRKGRPYIDPETGDNLGYAMMLVATSRAFRGGSNERNEPASLQILDVKREIRQGDIVLPALDGEALPAYFHMARPEQRIDGLIIETTSKLREFSKWDIVIINRGASDQLKPGHMLDILRPSPAVVDRGNGQPVYLEDASRYQRLASNFGHEQMQMPRERVGHLMVFKVTERASYAIVTDTYRPVRVGDHIVSP
ncbi:LysM peptidoglycan-binding domain-containing protein [Alkalimonas mucilaginosa]|uniref:LysM domain-containing protein n=1 Tax=Alkalimonas mucilaginosa TaxID=3057676 RepID=A0ABU7JFJ6_9GAMM|nr:LysM domain-containing protein [Alkalimonas sp. MEB004]MEE2024462.1 LysM domain-containing protein [Alkalimonas sp. MEB004]